MLAAVPNWHAVDTKTRAVRQQVSAFVAVRADHVDVEALAEELEDIPPQHDVVEDRVLRDDQHRAGCRPRLGSVIQRRIASESGLGCTFDDAPEQQMVRFQLPVRRVGRTVLADERLPVDEKSPARYRRAVAGAREGQESRTGLHHMPPYCPEDPQRLDGNVQATPCQQMNAVEPLHVPPRAAELNAHAASSGSPHVPRHSWLQRDEAPDRTVWRQQLAIGYSVRRQAWAALAFGTRCRTLATTVVTTAEVYPEPASKASIRSDGERFTPQASPPASERGSGASSEGFNVPLRGRRPCDDGRLPGLGGWFVLGRPDEGSRVALACQVLQAV